MIFSIEYHKDNTELKGLLDFVLFFSPYDEEKTSEITSYISEEYKTVSRMDDFINNYKKIYDFEIISTKSNLIVRFDPNILHSQDDNNPLEDNSTDINHDYRYETETIYYDGIDSLYPGAMVSYYYYNNGTRDIYDVKSIIYSDLVYMNPIFKQKVEFYVMLRLSLLNTCAKDLVLYDDDSVSKMDLMLLNPLTFNTIYSAITDSEITYRYDVVLERYKDILNELFTIVPYKALTRDRQLHIEVEEQYKAICDFMKLYASTQMENGLLI